MGVSGIYTNQMDVSGIYKKLKGRKAVQENLMKNK